ncbi:MAG: SAM-dependent methyltransferase [Candidatus Melainabacteria bacterium]|nr:MAG: SAM-dependent methyltransferase [Candidatus Melainabacteria bacterium]
MVKGNDCDPADKFTGLATLYDKARPGYPAAALSAILNHCGLAEGSTLVDVGCGTGIASRAFAQLGLQVIGIEPNNDMRAVAQSGNQELTGPHPSYREGKAEATGLPSACSDAVAAAQAFHWFDPEESLSEFYRIVKPGGWVILLWNERQEEDAFTRSYGDLIRTIPRAAGIELDRSQAGALLLSSPLFVSARQLNFPNEQILNETGVIDRAFSSSYAPRQADKAEELTKSLRKLFINHAHMGEVALKYVLYVYLAQKPR